MLAPEAQTGTRIQELPSSWLMDLTLLKLDLPASVELPHSSFALTVLLLSFLPAPPACLPPPLAYYLKTTRGSAKRVFFSCSKFKLLSSG